MNLAAETVVGILLPLFGTTLGAAAVFFIRGSASPRFHQAMLGFAAGIMTAASVWSLLLPSIEAAGSWFPAVTGFLIGTAAMLLLDTLVPLRRAPQLCDIALKTKTSAKLSEGFLLFIAVTLHNIPEGMAIGVAFAGLIKGIIPLSDAFALSVGIAVQNLPEGTIISAPLAGEGMIKKRAFICGMISGAVEPFAAVITLLLTQLIAPILPYVLALAAGAMIYVVSQELIPEAKAMLST